MNSNLSIIIFTFLIFLGFIMLYKETGKLENPLKDRIRDICTIGIIIFACGTISKYLNMLNCSLILAGLLINIYGALLFIYGEFRRDRNSDLNRRSD